MRSNRLTGTLPAEWSALRQLSSLTVNAGGRGARRSAPPEASSPLGGLLPPQWLGPGGMERMAVSVVDVHVEIGRPRASLCGRAE